MALRATPLPLLTPQGLTGPSTLVGIDGPDQSEKVGQMDSRLDMNFGDGVPGKSRVLRRGASG